MELEQPVDTHEAFQHIWIVWQLGGVLPFERFKAAFLFYSIFVNVIATFLLPVTIMISVLEEEDLQVALTSASYFLNTFALLLKQCTIIRYRRHIYNMREILKKLDRRAKHEDERLCLRDAVRLCQRLFRVYGILFYSAIVIIMITPFFSSRPFLFPTWFPFDITVAFNYRIAYAYHIYVLFIVATQTLALDIFPPSYICILCAQIKALGIRIGRMGREGITHDVNEIYKELNECIEDHKTILGLFREIRILTSRTVSVQFMVTGLIFGALTVNMLLFRLSFMEKLILFIFLLCVIFQTLPVCYCANTLQIFNETLTGAIFNCNWIDEDMKFRKSIIIFMQRTQQGLKILAWNVVPISLTTFLRIIKFSFSTFAILSQLKK